MRIADYPRIVNDPGNWGGLVGFLEILATLLAVV